MYRGGIVGTVYRGDIVGTITVYRGGIVDHNYSVCMVDILVIPHYSAKKKWSKEKPSHMLCVIKYGSAT